VVRITSTKWDGTAHRDNDAEYLGDDQYGQWFWMPDQTLVTTSNGIYHATPGLRLFPAGTWWSAFFVPPHLAAGRPEQWYVDVATPATRDGDVITFVDLDLDVERLDRGVVTILDRDEFDENRVRLGYPADVVARAVATADEVAEWMQSGREPFGVISQYWLARTGHY
jgi:protein associated with RNAse G/E